MIFRAYHLLEILEIFRKELYYLPACRTDHVVVMAVAIGVFIDISLVGSGDALYQPAFDQEVQCPVDRCPGGLDLRFLDVQVQVLRFKMAVDGKDLMQHRHAFLGQFEAALYKKVPEDFALHYGSIAEIEIKLQLRPGAQPRSQSLLSKAFLSLPIKYRLPEIAMAIEEGCGMTIGQLRPGIYKEPLQ